MNNLVIIATSNGLACTFDEKGIRIMGRIAYGITGIKIKKSTKQLCSESFTANDKELFIISENGYGKRLKIKELKIQRRGGCGIRIMNISSKSGFLSDIKVIPKNSKFVMILTKKGIVKKIMLTDVPIIGRNTIGLKLIKLRNDDKISSISII